MYLEAGQALTIEYLRSSESNADYMHVLVNGDTVYTISGYREEETWENCCPVVAEEDGYYEIILLYMKDGSIAEADDTFYIKSIDIANP